MDNKQEIRSSDQLATNLGFIKVQGSEWSYRIQCCMATKTDNKIQVALPIEWVTAYGFTKKDVSVWVDFINKALGANVTIKDDNYSFSSELANRFVTKGYPSYVRSAFDKRLFKFNQLPTPDHSDITKNEFYLLDIPKVYIKDSGHNFNYAIYVLLRFLTNHHYYPIVKKALEIRYKLTVVPNKELTAILLATCLDKYDPYYGLIGQYSREKTVIDFFNPISDKTWKNSYLNDIWNTVNLTEAQKALAKSMIKEENWKQLESFYFLAHYDKLNVVPVKNRIKSDVSPVKIEKNSIISSLYDENN